MSVHVIPTPLAQRAAVDRNPRNAGTAGIFDIAGRLGQAHRSIGYIVRHIDALIAGEGFPAPHPTYAAGRLVAGAHANARWARAAVDAWFLDRLPPAARGLIDQAERVTIDSRLSARAAALFRVTRPEGDAA